MTPKSKDPLNPPAIGRSLVTAGHGARKGASESERSIRFSTLLLQGILRLAPDFAFFGLRRDKLARWASARSE